MMHLCFERHELSHFSRHCEPVKTTGMALGTGTVSTTEVQVFFSGGKRKLGYMLKKRKKKEIEKWTNSVIHFRLASIHLLTSMPTAVMLSGATCVAVHSLRRSAIVSRDMSTLLGPHNPKSNEHYL